MRTHIDALGELLLRVPMVTKYQAALYLADIFQEPILLGVYNSMDYANKKKIFWFEHFKEKDGKEIVGVSRDKIREGDEKSRLFPYAFWLYLSLREIDKPCQEAEDPFTAVFTVRLGEEDRIAQVLVYDPKRKRPMILRHEVYAATQREAERYCGKEIGKILKEEMPQYFWRLMVIVDPPKGFFESNEFQYLRGLGFVKFCTARSCEETPNIIFSEEDEQAAWSFVLDLPEKRQSSCQGKCQPGFKV